MTQIQKKRRAAWMRTMFVTLTWLLIWSVVAAWMDKPLLLPGPGDTLCALGTMVRTGIFWKSVGVSLWRVMVGYGLAVLLGSVLAFACHFFKVLDAFLSPLRTIIRTTPVTSFIILVLLWLDYHTTPIFISFLMVLPILWTNVQEGLDHTDPELLEMTRCYRYSAWRRFRHLYVPSVMPHFAAACATGLGFAWKSGIAAEVIAKPFLSIGRNLQDAKVYLETAQLFAWTFVVIVLSLCLEKMLKYALKRIKTRKGGRT